MIKSLSSLLLFVALLSFSECGKKDDVSINSTFTISPTSGNVGTLIDIHGAGFNATVAGDTVKVNGTVAYFFSGNATDIVAYIPAGGTTGPVTVISNGKTFTGPTFTYVYPYNVIFKANGTATSFDGTGGVYNACGNCACSSMPPLASDNVANINLCFAENYSVEAADLLGFQGKTYQFSSTTFPIPHFGYTIAGVDFSSDNVADQTGSSLTISKVEYETSLYEGQLNTYKITGTFSCKVAKPGKSPIAVTEGTFIVEMSEN